MRHADKLNGELLELRDGGLQAFRSQESEVGSTDETVNPILSRLFYRMINNINHAGVGTPEDNDQTRGRIYY